MQTKMLIGGAQEAGTETEEQVLNPRTGKLILAMPEADLDQVNRAGRTLGQVAGAGRRDRGAGRGVCQA